MRTNTKSARLRLTVYGGVSLLSLMCVNSSGLAQETLPVINIGEEIAANINRRRASDATPAEAKPTPGEAIPGDVLIDPASDKAANPKSTITMEGIRILGGPAQASSYKPLDLLPSVIEDSADPYGLSFNRSITIRGVSDFFMSRTTNGLPITGIVGGADLFDLNNLASIDVYRGSLQANQGFGFSNVAGVLDQRLLPPKEKFSGAISQGVGSDGFWRTFARVDSGLLATGTSFFVSGSIADAQKWKGAGDAERKNVMFGVTQTLGDHLDVAMYGVHNDQKANNYLPLTYAQTQNLGVYAWQDYNTSLTGKSTVDNNSYLFNLQKYVDNAIFAEITYHITPNQTFVLKPYYWRNEGDQLLTSGAGVKNWPINNYTLGGVAEYKNHLPWGGDFVLGYWGEAAKPEPPPLGQQQFTVTTIGTLAFASWSTLATSTNHEFYSPYTQYTQEFDATTLTGGVRLHIEGTPQMQYYKTVGLPDVSYANVFSFLPTPDLNGGVAARDYYEWLPNVGVRQKLSNEWSLNASYSRKIARPDWGPQASTFTSNEAAFLKDRMNLQSLMNMIRPELVDEVDVGARYQAGALTVVPTFFGFWTHKKEVLVYDPNVGQSYYQSNAATTGYGFEIEAGWKATDWLTLTATGTDAAEIYNANISTGRGTTMLIGGKQVPYTPKYMAKLAVTYHKDGFEFTPVIRYVGVRYGLADDSQWVSPYTVVDVTASYEFGTKLGLTPMTINAGVMNLFDRRYIGAISVNEDNLSSTSYYVAPPRTIFTGVTAKF